MKPKLLGEIKPYPITKDGLRKAFSKDLAQLTAQSSTPERAYETSVDNLYALFEQAWNRRPSSGETMVPCVWIERDSHVYVTSCGNSLSNDVDNYAFKHCGFCSKPISYAPKEKGQP